MMDVLKALSTTLPCPEDIMTLVVLVVAPPAEILPAQVKVKAKVKLK